MKNYELIIERNQPSCGGKDPKNVKIMSVSTDDPVAYVRSLEKNGELEVSTNDNGELVVSLDVGKKQVTYTFTED